MAINEEDHFCKKVDYLPVLVLNADDDMMNKYEPIPEDLLKYND